MPAERPTEKRRLALPPWLVFGTAGAIVFAALFLCKPEIIHAEGRVQIVSTRYSVEVS